MGHLVKKLSVKLVENLNSPGYYGDGDGLWLRIAKGGSKSWIFRFTIAGKAREMGLGGLNAVSLAIARERAGKCRLLLSEGKDPIVDRNAVRTSDALRKSRLTTFDQCASAYISAQRASWKNPKHIAQWESTLANYASPVFGTLPVSDVDTDLVVKCCGPSGTSRPRRQCACVAASSPSSTGPPSASTAAATILRARGATLKICWPIRTRSRRS